jgi:hypothetical protein
VISGAGTSPVLFLVSAFQEFLMPATQVRLNQSAYTAIRDFRRAKPWRGTYSERSAKFDALHATLMGAYGLHTALLREPGPDACSGASEFCEVRDAIIQRGRLSVVTYFYLLAVARGKQRAEAMVWAVGVFQRMFPVSFARCSMVGGLMRRNAR